MRSKKQLQVGKRGKATRRTKVKSKLRFSSSTGARAWDDETIKALRAHLKLTQAEMARELGTRQQTISEWEVGLYKPRGGMARLLTMVAEKSRFRARTASEQPDDE